MPTCRELMTREPVCCEPNDAVTRVAELMKKEDVGSVPVVESLASRRLVGIVTDRDLVTKVVAGGRAVEQATARDAMTFNPATCAEEDDISHDAVDGSAPGPADAGRHTGSRDVESSRRRTWPRACGATARSGQMVESISEPPLQR